MAYKRVLGPTQTTSDEFAAPGGLAHLLLSGHSGGTWKLQVKDPDGTWVDLDGDTGVTFDDDGMVTWYGTAHLMYRLTGGTVGAKAWMVSNAPAPGISTAF